jgi:hypothetical protein
MRTREECLSVCESVYVGLDSMCTMAFDAMNNCVAGLQPDQWDCDPGLKIDGEPCATEIAALSENGCVPSMAAP